MKQIFWIFLAIIASACVSNLFAKSQAVTSPDIGSIVKVFKDQKIDYYLFSNTQNNKFLVVPKFGGRILAVDLGGENVFWTHPDILRGQGGQRSWISPEGGAKGFILRPDWKGNRDFSMLDPGHYKVLDFKNNEYLSLANTFQVTSNDGQENYYLTLTREMKLGQDPLLKEPQFKSLKYQFLGIDFVHKLKNNSQVVLDKILALWSLIQVPPRGTMIVPVEEVVREAWRGNYFEPIPDEYVKANPDSFSFYVEGSRRYKVGLRPQSVKGIISYLARAKDNDFFMIIMTFPVKPEAPYVDRPRTEQQTNGDCIQIYSHLEEAPLAFGEMECHSWGLELPPGSEQAFPIKIYIYKASLEILKKIGSRLVCPHFDKACLFK